MPTAEFIHADGDSHISEITLNSDGDYPSPLLDGAGDEWVLAQRPGIAENVQILRIDGSLEPAPTIARYHQSKGADATCLTCGFRSRYASHITADYALKMCRSRDHDTLIIPVHLDDANVIPHLQRTVGDVRESTELIETAMNHLWDRIYRWAILYRIRRSAPPGPSNM